MTLMTKQIMLKNTRNKKLLKFALLLALGAAAFILLWPVALKWYYGRYTFTPKEAPSKRVAIVFGAAVYQDGTLSPMLQDRVETAVQLYQQGKVQKLLLSGDNRFADYNEPGAMQAYALSRGVPGEDIQLDYAGRRTYDTCYRAKAVFQLDEAVLVTQAFHLPRAIFTCQHLGVEAIGVVADRRPYDPRSVRWSTLREVASANVALLNVLIKKPAPVLGEPILIE